MRSAQFIDVFYPHIDGVITVVDNYARLLNGTEGDSCFVFAPDCGKNDTDRGYGVIRANSVKFVQGYYLPLTAFSPAAKKAAASLKPEVIHAHSPFTVGHFAKKLAQNSGVPFVCTFHSKYYDDFLEATHSKLIAEQVVDYIIRLYNCADSVWTVGNGTAGTLRDYGFKGDIFVLDNGCDVFAGDADSLAREAKSRFSLPEKGKTLVFAGSQVWKKNIKLVLDTLALLKPEGFKLISVGSGDNEKEIKKYAEKTGVSDSVIFTGKVADRDLLAGIYRSSDMLFFPSEYDNAPMVVREAASLCVPSMLLKGSNSADRIDPGVNGFVCPNDAEGCAEAIRSAFSDPAKLLSAGKAASQTVCVPWESIVSQARDKYAELIKDHKKITK
ncbi:MAG: glycosyltransferase [Clostridia bacterium]|nr:glycosyltransferase [Clostridia bacterium]